MLSAMGGIASKWRGQRQLLNLGFLERNVLPNHGIILVQLKLRGLRTRIFFCHIEEARIRRGDELDLNGVRFGH